MDNCWISCQIMADMEKLYSDLIIIYLYIPKYVQQIYFMFIQKYLLWINCSECGDKGVVGEVTNVDPLDIEVSCPITELKLWPICFNLL